MNKLTDAEARDAIISIGRRMYEKGFVASNDGNISVKTDDGIWMTPSGVSKGELTPDILVKIDCDGNIIEGSRKISTETAMHLRIYKENGDICAVTHAHPPASTAFAIARIPLDCRCYPEALVNLGEVPVAEYAAPGSGGVPDSVAPYVKAGFKCVLLANHGAVTWGRDPGEAWFRLEALENFAKISIFTHILGGGVRLTDVQLNELGIVPPVL